MEALHKTLLKWWQREWNRELTQTKITGGTTIDRQDISAYWWQLKTTKVATTDLKHQNETDNLPTQNPRTAFDFMASCTHKGYEVKEPKQKIWLTVYI